MKKTMTIKLEFEKGMDVAEETKKFRKCGCFYCLRVLSPSEIKEWCDESENGEGMTAICPYCDVDAILSESSGYPLSQDFLSKMRKRWFE